MTKLQRLQQEANAAVKAARDVAEVASAAQRSMTADEQKTYDESMAKGRELLEQIKTAKADEQVLADAKALADEIGLSPEVKEDLDAQRELPTRERAKNLGLQIVGSDAFKAMIGAFPDGRIPEKSRIQSDPISVKSLIRSKSLFTGASDTSAGTFVVNDQSGIVEMLGRRTLTVRDLISVRRTGSDAVEYVRQTSHTNNAAPVAEATTSAAPTIVNTEGTPNVSVVTRAAGGGYKPEGAWAFERDVTNVKTIAEWVPATKRSLADVAALEGLINDELVADIEEAEENEIVNGSGSGEHLTGILNTSGIQSQAFATDLFVSVRKGITKARKIGRVVPNGIMMAPEDVELVDLARDSEQRFYGGGPFMMGPRTLWGYPLIESEAITPGNCLLGDFSKAVLWDREQTTVTMTDSHEDFFIRNLVAILAEERVAFAVTRPTAFVNVDISA